MLIFIYHTFEFKICLHYKPYKFPTKTFGGMCFCIYILGFLVNVPLLVPALENC